jgi:hypothetical protein
MKKKVILSHIYHKEKDCLSIGFPYDSELIAICRKYKEILWSKYHKTFYIPFTKENLNKLTSEFEKIAIVKYYKKGEKIEKNTKSNTPSIFISYSFQDSLFANNLNNLLIDNNINTFLWEKNAPGGKPLKSIMLENISKFDRILFIASKNSIKSQACQFELTQGRIKQEKLWKTIFFPIHIDKFLFEVEKEQIRPRTKKDEFWENIEEIKMVNSIDFSEFSGKIFDSQKFEKKVEKLIADLEEK